MALHLNNPFEHREHIDAGVRWLTSHQNADGGWGDTIKSFSNISTTMLCRAALRLTGAEKDHPESVEKVEDYLNARAGRRPEQRAEAIRRRYGKDRTFSVPILMSCALAGLVPWREVPRLPFEAAALPQSWYRFARMPVVSYALPALIAIGQCVHAKRGTWNPLTKLLRWLTRGRTLNVLRRIQPTSGGYLEATPLTSFVVMALSSIRRWRRSRWGRASARRCRSPAGSSHGRRRSRGRPCSPPRPRPAPRWPPSSRCRSPPGWRSPPPRCC
jgi:squalene-hopene/tetraprenyl-beta-curcumene cyclase